MSQIPPQHVVSAFTTSSTAAMRGNSPKQLGAAWSNGWLIGDTVFSETGTFGAFSARVREKLTVEGARVVKPLRSTDGRYNVAGWLASAYVPGEPAKRIDETAMLALRVEEALEDARVSLPNAGNAATRTDVFARAEQLAWEETGEAYRELPVNPAQLVVGHADMVASTLYSGSQAPVITTIMPTAHLRPRGYSAALAIVDGLIHGAVDDAVCQRFNFIEHFDQLLLRSVAYRRHVNDLHPGSKAHMRSSIERVESLLMSQAGATM